jgi:hypothetical protein
MYVDANLLNIFISDRGIGKLTVCVLSEGEHTHSEKISIYTYKLEPQTV